MVVLCWILTQTQTQAKNDLTLMLLNMGYDRVMNMLWGLRVPEDTTYGDPPEGIVQAPFSDEDNGETFHFVYIENTLSCYDMLKYYCPPDGQDEDDERADPPREPSDDEYRKFIELTGVEPKFYVIRTSG